MMFLKEIPGFQWNSPPENNFVDHHVFQKLAAVADPALGPVHRRRVRPSRVYLDVIGMLPEPSETAEVSWPTRIRRSEPS